VNILGVDPGLGGALAFCNTKMNHTAVFDMPTLVLSRGGKNKREIDMYNLANLIRNPVPIDHAFVEQVGSMPGQGVSSVFAFGKSYGIVLGVLAALGIPMTLVSPRKWKAALGVPAAKDGARARASQLMPGSAVHWPLVKHSDRAEAALIALYGVRLLNSNEEAA
jgi:crossover junction endodeoxyribonuclease RuvC